MKEFDVFEKNLKDTLGAYSETKPSKKLWVRISTSLLLLPLLSNTYLKGFIIAAISVAGISWAISSNNFSNNNDNINADSNSEIAITNTNNSTEGYNNTTESINLNSEDKAENSKLENKFEGKSVKQIDNYTLANNNSGTIKQKTKSSNSIDKSKNNVNNKNIKRTSIVATTNILDDKTNIIKPEKILVSRINVKEEEKTSASNINKAVESKAIAQNTQQRQSIKPSNKPIIKEYSLLSLNSVMNMKINHIAMTRTHIEPIKPIRNRVWYNYELAVGGQLNYSDISLNPINISDKELNKSSLMLDYNYGGNINLYRNKWFIRLGINYNNYSEQYSYSTTSLKIDSSVYSYFVINRSYTQTITAWNHNVGPGVDSIPIYTQTVVETKTENSITEYDSTKEIHNYQYKNEYSMINIPFSLGREFNYNSFVFDVAAGVSWSRIIKTNAYILDPESGEVLDIDNNNPIINKNIFNGTLSIGAGYKINRANIVFIRPELYYNFNSIFDKTYFDKHKMYQMRISLGVRFIIR